MAIDEYLRETSSLVNRVDNLSAHLNQDNLLLGDLIKKMESLFALFYRSDTLIKIIQDYTVNFQQGINAVKESQTQREQYMSGVGERLDVTSQSLRRMSSTMDTIRADAERFIKSAHALSHLAKNTEIRAYQAKQEGRGLAIIAKESLRLAQLTRVPFERFSTLLEQLRLTAEPMTKDMDRVLATAREAHRLLGLLQRSLTRIQDGLQSLKEIIGSVQENSTIHNLLKDSIADELAVLNRQSAYSLNTMDTISLQCAELNSLAQQLHNLDVTVQSAGNGDANRHLERQLRYVLGENIRVMGRLSGEKSPPLFPPQVYQTIRRIQDQIGVLNLSITELLRHTERIHTGMDELLGLNEQLEDFAQKAQQIFANQRVFAESLRDDLERIDELMAETTKIFSRIKTLAIFTRLEESRSRQYHDMIAPVVVEYNRLETQTERAFLKIVPALSLLRQDARTIFVQSNAASLPAADIPDYGKLRIFLDDMLRVFKEMEDRSVAVAQVADELNNRNVNLRQLWRNYELIQSNILKTRTWFEQRAQKTLAAPAVIPQRTSVAVNLSDEPITLQPDQKTDANSHLVINNFCIGLFQFGDGADVLPAICQEYSLSSDGTELTLVIRDDVQYADGRKLRVEDVRDGINRMLAGPNANLLEMIHGTKDYQASHDARALGIKILNHQTLRLRLEYPYPPLLASLATNVADPVRANEPFPIGTGPFQIASWERGKCLTMTANDYFFEGRPAIDEFNIIFLDDDDQLYEMFRAGELSICRPGNKALIRFKQEYPKQIMSVPEFSVQYLCMNCAKPPFDNRDVRRAVCWAIDVPRMVTELQAGRALPARGIFPPCLKVYNPRLTGYQYAPDRSRACLAAAGYPHGLPDTYPIDIPDSESSVRLAESIKQYLERVGIKISIRTQPWRALLDKTYRGDFFLAPQGWISDNGDPDNFLYPLFHSRSFGHPGNTFFFATPGIDASIEHARQIRNAGQRIAAYRTIEEQIIDEAPGVFLYHSVVTIVVQKDIAGIKPHPLGLVRAKHLYRGGLRA